MQINPESEFTKLTGSLESYLYRLTANRQDAEDLLHDTFIIVKQSFASFKGLSSFKTWVFSIATNLARDNHRVKNRWAVDVQDLCKQAAIDNSHYAERMVAAFQSQPEQRFELAEHINYCFTCLSKNLSLEKQIAIVLKEMYAFKRSEIAEIMHITEGVVKHLLFDGRKDLQEKYNHRCALINKTGACYQCAELNNYFQGDKSADEKVKALGLGPENSAEDNLDQRFQLISRINPLTSNGAVTEDVILQILRETIQDK
ncbi:MAG: RNA polymerase sigma factor [Bacteroidia bacterium]